MLARRCDLVGWRLPPSPLASNNSCAVRFSGVTSCGAAGIPDPAVGFAQRHDIQENGSPGAVGRRNVGPLMFIG